MRPREQERRKRERERERGRDIPARLYVPASTYELLSGISTRGGSRVRARAHGLTHPRRINSMPTCRATEATCPEASPGLLSVVVYAIKSPTAGKKVERGNARLFRAAGSCVGIHRGRFWRLIALVARRSLVFPLIATRAT